MKNRLKMLLSENPEVMMYLDEYLNYRDDLLLNRIESMSLGCKYNNQQKDLGFMVEHGMRSEAIKEIVSYTKGAKEITVIDPYMLGSITAKSEINERFINIASDRKVSIEILNELNNELNRSFQSVEKLLIYIKRKVDLSSSNEKKLKKIATDLFIDDCYISDFMKAISSKTIKKLNVLYSGSHSSNSRVRKELINKCRKNVFFHDLDENEDIAIHDRIWIIDSQKAIVVGNSFGGLGMHAISFILPLPNEDLENLKRVLSECGIKI